MSRYVWEMTDELVIRFSTTSIPLVRKIAETGKLVCFSVDNPAGLSYRFFGEPEFRFIPMHRICSVSWSELKLEPMGPVE